MIERETIKEAKMSEVTKRLKNYEVTYTTRWVTAHLREQEIKDLELGIDYD